MKSYSKYVKEQREEQQQKIDSMKPIENIFMNKELKELNKQYNL